MDVAGLKRDLAAAASDDPPYPSGRFAGRGVVICAGGPRLFTGAWIAIAGLRDMGCDLPIEVWHLGSAEMGPAMKGLLGELGTEAVDAFEVARRHLSTPFHGWSLKSYAVKNCRFREVLLMDADNGALRDPGFLFEDAGYRETGALFWPDACRIAPDNRIWDIAGLDPEAGPAFESGQLVIDKARAWAALCLADWLNQRSQDVYNVLYGDKDTFLIAWRMKGAPFSLIPHPCRLVNESIIQAAPDGTPLFQHRTNAKLILHGRNQLLAEFAGEPEVMARLDRLRTLWDGWVFSPPARSDAARAAEAALIAQRRLLLVRIADGAGPVELLPDHRIGRGAAPDRVYWHVEDGRDGPELLFSHQGLIDAVMMLDADGIWRGRQTTGPKMAIELRPAALGANEASKTAPPSLTPETLIAAFTDISLDGEAARDLTGLVRGLVRARPDLSDAVRTAAGRRAGTRLQTVVEDALTEIGPAGERRPVARPLTGEGIYQDWRYEPI